MLFVQVNAFIGSKVPATTGIALKDAITGGELAGSLQTIGLTLDPSAFAITVRLAKTCMSKTLVCHAHHHRGQLHIASLEAILGSVVHKLVRTKNAITPGGASSERCSLYCSSQS
jgi:hypothetical protein